MQQYGFDNVRNDMEGKIVKWKFKNDIKYLTIDGWSNGKL